ncbi:unnamed protein product, partial [Brenthis ino]
MEYTKCLIIFLFSVSYIECKSWYPTTDIQGLNLNSVKNDQESRYITTTRHLNSTSGNDISVYISTQGSEYKPSNPLQISIMNSPNMPISKSNRNSNTFLNDAENFKNTSSRSKGKLVRRRCPQTPKQKCLNSSKAVQSRILEVFEVVQFEHIACFSSTGLEGTCLHEYDCQKINGTAMGACADGYGTCCIILLQCDTRSSAPTGWFTNPNYPGPSTDRLSCAFTLDKTSADVKQLRLDFMTFEITQLNSYDALSAPTGCLQYFKEDHGYVESFNYRDSTEIGITRTPSYLNNLNYAICIERKPASCSVAYTNVGDMQIVNYDTDGLPILPPQQAGVEIFDCPSDWLLISALRLCGERLNDGSVLQDFSLDAPVTDDGAGPILVWFRSDGIYSGRGFRLHYQQNNCTT